MSEVPPGIASAPSRELRRRGVHDWTLLDRLPALSACQTPRLALSLARAVTLVLISLPFVLLFVPWQQNVTAKGRVIAYAPLERRQPVQAPVYGRVTEWLVREGSRVKKGEKLLQISDNDPSIMQRLGEQVVALRAKIDASRAKAESYTEQMQAYRRAETLALQSYDWKIKMLEEKITAQENEVAAKLAGFKTAEINIERQKALFKDGLVSKREFELAELKFEQTRTGLDQSKAKLRALEREREGTRAERGKTKADFDAKVNSSKASADAARSDLAEAEGKMSELSIKRARQSNMEVVAPMEGTVLRLEAALGDFVKVGETLLVIVPDTESLAVELFVDGNDQPLVTEGRHVRLQFEGWPAVQFSGWPSVAIGTFEGVVRLVDRTDDGKGKFRILVRPPDLPEGATPSPDQIWPESQYLRQGVRAKGWLLLNQVTLGYELWRRLNGFPPVVSQDVPGKDSFVPKKK